MIFYFLLMLKYKMKLTFLLFILLISIATIKGNYLRQRLDEEDQNKLDKNNSLESLKLVIRDLVI